MLLQGPLTLMLVAVLFELDGTQANSLSTIADDQARIAEIITAAVWVIVSIFHFDTKNCIQRSTDPEDHLHLRPAPHSDAISMHAPEGLPLCNDLTHSRCMVLYFIRQWQKAKRNLKGKTDALMESISKPASSRYSSNQTGNKLYRNLCTSPCIMIQAGMTLFLHKVFTRHFLRRRPLQ